MRQYLAASIVTVFKIIARWTKAPETKNSCYDAAMKVVEICSVGIPCWILLMLAGADDPLLMEVKGGSQFRFGAVCSPKLKASNTVDWFVRESVRARLRVMVKTILKRWKYPPEGQEAATETVLEQGKELSATWATV